MSTGYIISPGYQSGESTKLTNEQIWQALRLSALQLCQQPERIAAEAARLDAPETCEQGCCTLESLAEAYKDAENGILHIDEHKQHVLQFASGTRKIKEHIRRAFCRLVIEDMHRQGIEVCLQVV